MALTVAVVALVGFVLVQARVRHPMMPLDLFQARGFRLALPVGFAFMVGNYGNVFVVSLFLQQELAAVTAARRPGVPAVGVLRDRRQPGLAGRSPTATVPASRRRRTDVDGGRPARPCCSSLRWATRP